MELFRHVMQPCLDKSGLHCTSAYIFGEFRVVNPVAYLRRELPEAALNISVFNNDLTARVKAPGFGTFFQVIHPEPRPEFHVSKEVAIRRP